MEALRVSEYQFQVLEAMERHGRLSFVPMWGRYSVGRAGERKMIVMRATVRSFIRQGLVCWAAESGRGMLDAVITDKGRAALSAQRIGMQVAA